MLNQLHINHMGIDVTRLWEIEFIYWIDINTDIEEPLKNVLHVLISRQHSPLTE